VSALTAREVQTLKLLVRGLCQKQIAVQIKISGRTVENHVRDIKKKTGATSLAQLGWLARDILEPGSIKDNNFVHSWHLLTPHVQDLISQLVTEFDIVGIRTQHLIDKIKQLQSQQLTKEDSNGQSKETKEKSENGKAVPPRAQEV